MAPTAMIVWILCLILISVAFVRWQWSVQLFLIVGVLVFLVGALTGLTNEPLSVFGALVMGLTWLLLYHASGIRKKYLTRPVFDRMQKALQTDIRAVHGSKSDRMPGWEAALFNGHPDWDRLLATSRPELNDEERNFIGGPVEALCALMLDGSTHQDALCAQIQDFFRENEFFALTVPREYDGKGFSDHALSCITLRLSSSYWPLVVSTMTPHLHGLGRLLDHYGSDLQKYHYLPRIASGEEIPWLMLIEGLLDSSNTLQGGIVCKIRRQGVDKLGFRVNWTNQQILSNSEVTVIGLIFCTYDPDGILDDGQFPKVVCALVPIGTEGITTHPYQETQQPHRSGILVHGNDVLIPFDWILGNPAQVEQGDNLEQMETRLVEENQFLIALATGMTKAAARSSGLFKSHGCLSYCYCMFFVKQPDLHKI